MGKSLLAYVIVFVQIFYVSVFSELTVGAESLNSNLAPPIVQYNFDNDLDNSAKIIDSSGNQNDGKLSYLKTHLKPGHFEQGNAIEFKGDGSYVQVPNLGALDELSITTWIFPKDLSLRRNSTLFESNSEKGGIKLYFADNLEEGANRNNVLVFQVNGNVGGNYKDGSVCTKYVRFGENEYMNYYRGGQWERNQYQHYWVPITVTYKPQEKKVEFYIYDKLDSVQTFDIAEKPVLDNARIGSSFKERQGYNGRLDDFAIYDRILPIDEIRELSSFEKYLWAIRYADQWEPSHKVFYVDGAKGNDNNVGTNTAPFKSIKKGLSAVNEPGVKLIIMPGLYKEHDLSINQYGTPTKPVIIEAAEPGKTIISGAESLSGDWEKLEDNLYKRDWPYDWGLTTTWEPDQSSVTSLKTRNSISVDNRILREVRKKGEMTLSTFYVDMEEKIVYAMLDKDINKCDVKVPVQERMLNVNLQYFILRGIRFEDIGGYGDAVALKMGNSKHVLIEDCEAARVTGTFLQYDTTWGSATEESIFHTAHDGVFRRIKAYDTGCSAFSTGFRNYNFLFEDCSSSRNGWKLVWGRYGSWAWAAVNKTMWSANIMYRRVRITDALQFGFWPDNGNWNITWDNCTFLRNRTGMWIEINQSGMEVRNSTYVDNLDAGLNISSSYETRVDNNIFYGTNRVLASWEPWEETGGFRFGGFGSHHIEGPDSNSDNLTFTNNYVVSPKETYDLVQWPGYYESYFRTMTIANNKFYAPNPQKDIFAMDSIRTWDQFKAKLPQDTTSTWLDENPFDDDRTVTIQFAKASSVSPKTNLPIYVPIIVSKPVYKSMAVDYTVVEEGKDNVLKQGTIIFDPLVREQVICIQLNKDEIRDTNKNIKIQLRSPQNVTLGEQLIHTLVINAEQKREEE